MDSPSNNYCIIAILLIVVMFSMRSSSMDVTASLGRSTVSSLKTRQRSSDLTSARTAIRSSDFSINGIERLKNRERLIARYELPGDSGGV